MVKGANRRVGRGMDGGRGIWVVLSCFIILSHLLGSNGWDWEEFLFVRND